MRKSYRFLSMYCIASLFTIALYAQPATISGVIRNSSSKDIVPAVSVIVKGSSLGTFTNSNGEFSITVERLPVTLVFSSIGYDTYEKEINDASIKIEIEFKPVSTLGQEVVVAATRTPTRILESPVTVERMSSAAMRTLPAPSYYEAINNLKGVDMHTASLTFRTVTTRGFVASGNLRLNQLVDGMDNQAPGLNFSVGNIVGPTDLDVENVELLAGASSALYGSGGMNGTLLINSKNPFKYQGFSFNIRQGIMHIDDDATGISPYYNWDFRWAKAFKNKFAIKITASMVSAVDWAADDYRNKEQVGILSAVKGGNRDNDPNYNGINIYGDEASVDMNSFAQVAISRAPAALVGAANAYFGPLGPYPTNAQVAAFVGAFPAAQQPAVQQFLPFYLGYTKNYFGNTSVSRTGYNESDLVDYNSLNVKFNIGLHYMITPSIEASWNTYFGTGTSVYTGADRYSLRNFKIGQHKLEFKGKTWYVRGYTTQENAGDSYHATALGVYINNRWKANETWFGQYIGTFSETRRQTMGSMSDVTIHSSARATADVGRLVPGTSGYQTVLEEGREISIADGGAKFLDKSDLWAADAQLNLSDVAHFSEKLQVIVGAQWKQNVINSQGTIFADTAGVIKINEIGGYVQLSKKLFNDVVTLTAAGRYDKQTNFEGRFTPRFTGVFRIAKDNNIRLSYQTAYRFPTNQDQYISLITQAGILIGCLPEFQDFYGLKTNQAYTAESIIDARKSNDLSKLVLATYTEVKPEKANSYEIGYKGILGGKLLVDGYLYYCVYKDFLSRIGVGQSLTGAPSGVLSALATRNISYAQNAPGEVKASGWGIGLEYQAVKGYTLYGNIFSDNLDDVPEGYITYFNAPKYRWNLGLRNENVYRHVGFNVVVKWQDNNYYQGTFVTGTLPYFAWVDAQVTYRMPNTKSVFRIGGTNIGNAYYRTGYGSPYVGGLYYVSYGYNIF